MRRLKWEDQDPNGGGCRRDQERRQAAEIETSLCLSVCLSVSLLLSLSLFLFMGWNGWVIGSRKEATGS